MFRLLLKIIGWLFVPFIMLPIQWKKMNKPVRFLGTAWCILFIIAAIAGGEDPQTTNQASTSGSSSSATSSTVSSSTTTANTDDKQNTTVKESETNTTASSSTVESEKTTTVQNKEETKASNISSNNNSSSEDKKTTASTSATDSKDKNYDVVLYFPASKYPETAAHIESAISKGESSICTIDRDGAEENREESLEGIATKSGYDRDEWPMAMCAEGGAGADIAYIDPSDNRGAGSWVGNQLESYSDGTRVLFVIDGNTDGKVLSATKSNNSTSSKATASTNAGQSSSSTKSSSSTSNSSSSTKSSSSSSSSSTSSEKKTESNKSNVVYYKNCSAVRDAGKAPLYKGDPGYSSKLDRDGDGVACE